MPLLAPLNVSAGLYAAGDVTATITWDAAAGANKYRVEAFSAGVLDASLSKDVTGATTIVMDSLNDLKIYTFKVIAINTANGEESPASAATVAPTLAAPVLDASQPYAAGDASAVVKFSPVTGASLYRVVSSPDSLSVVAQGDSELGGVQLSGLDTKKIYQFSVTALNNNGYESAASGLTAAPLFSAPNDGVAMYAPGAIQATISFTEVAGASEYQVEAFESGVSTGMIKISSATSIVFSGLSTDKVYQFKLKSINKNAMSAQSDLFPDPALDPIAPGAPVITSVIYVPGDLKATVYFTAPANHGGAPLGLFTATALDPDNAGNDIESQPGASSPIEITGLDTSKKYRFMVTVVSSIESDPPLQTASAMSAALAVVAPSAPVLTLVKGINNGVEAAYKTGDTSAKIIYDLPVSYGGAAISDFVVTSEPALPAGATQTDHLGPTPGKGYTIVNGLSASTSYVFMVQAVNSAGSSAKSNASAPQHVPVEVNLNVEITAEGKLNILSEALRTPENVICATEKLAAKALYDSDAATGCEMIEFWEDDNYNGLHARLAPRYQKSASRLARGLQKVLCGEMIANKQNVPRMDGSTSNFITTPFNDDVYKISGALVPAFQKFEHFGRVAIACYAHYVLGHAQATAAITNDKEFMRDMLSLTAMDKLDHLDANERLKQYKHKVDLDTNAENVHNWALDGSKSNADLARRLVRALVDANYNSALEGDARLIVSDETDTAKGLLIDLVKQVVGRDVSRAMGDDNNKYGPENHGMLRFFNGDVVYVNIKLVTPEVVVADAQKITKGQLEGQYKKQENYTIRIELSDDAAIDAIPA